MTLAISHTLPVGSLDISQMKEQLSLACAHLVSAAAGLTVGRWETDMGAVDLTLKSEVEYSNVISPTIDLQMKCTSSDSHSSGDFVLYSINRRTYEKMTSAKRNSPAILCITIIPVEPGHWLHYDTNGLLARAHTYWMPARDFPLLPDHQASIQVKVPKSNEFTAAQLLTMIKDLYGAEEI